MLTLEFGHPSFEELDLFSCEHIAELVKPGWGGLELDSRVKRKTQVAACIHPTKGIMSWSCPVVIAIGTIYIYIDYYGYLKRKHVRAPVNEAFKGVPHLSFAHPSFISPLYDMHSSHGFMGQAR